MAVLLIDDSEASELELWKAEDVADEDVACCGYRGRCWYGCWWWCWWCCCCLESIMPALVQMLKSFVDRIFRISNPTPRRREWKWRYLLVLKKKNQRDQPVYQAGNAHCKEARRCFSCRGRVLYGRRASHVVDLQRLRNNRVCRATADRRKSNRSISSDPTATEQFRS